MGNRMFQRIEDAGNISLGDGFIKFEDDLESFHEGVVVEMEGHDIVVDFGDVKAEWPRDEVAKFVQGEGVYREFYSSAMMGHIIADYR